MSSLNFARPQPTSAPAPTRQESPQQELARLRAMVASQDAKIAALSRTSRETHALGNGATCFVSEKGCLCVSLPTGGWPLSKYGDEWDALLGVADAIREARKALPGIVNKPAKS